MRDGYHVRTGPAPGRRIGYLIAAGVNAVGLWVANHLLEWSWPPFLTDGFAELLPLVNLSLAAALVVNLMWTVWDPEAFRHLAQVVLNGISMLLAVRTWQVFPFDFDTVASNPELWVSVARMAIGATLAALAVATVVELVRLVRPTEARSTTGPPTVVAR